MVSSSKVVSSLSLEKFKQRLNEQISGIQWGSNSKVLFNVSFSLSSNSMHFERHFTYCNLVPPRDSLSPTSPTVSKLLSCADKLTLNKWDEILSKISPNNVLKYILLKCETDKQNSFYSDVLCFLEHPRRATLEDWAVGAKGSEINGMQFSAICDKFLAFLCTWKSSRWAEAKLLTKRLFRQASSSHPSIVFSWSQLFVLHWITIK